MLLVLVGMRIAFLRNAFTMHVKLEKLICFRLSESVLSLLAGMGPKRAHLWELTFLEIF